jgi:hypothetical protein
VKESHSVFVGYFKPRCGSSLFHGAKAASTYGDRLGVAADRNLYLADIGLPTSVGLAVGVRNVLTKHNAFVANTAFCHL